MSQNTTVFITGDRKGCEVFTVAGAMLKAVADGRQIATGDNYGTEQFVRELAQRAGVSVNILATPRTDEGYADFPALHSALKEDEVEVLFFHPEPESSRIGRSLVEAGLVEAPAEA